MNTGAKGRRTYWHLEGLDRKPSPYDIVTTRLLRRPEAGFELELPLSDWYRRYQLGTPLKCADWDAFRDPRETTYARYVEIRAGQESFVEQLLAVADQGDADAQLASPWRAALRRVLPPLRYPCTACRCSRPMSVTSLPEAGWPAQPPSKRRTSSDACSGSPTACTSSGARSRASARTRARCGRTTRRGSRSGG